MSDSVPVGSRESWGAGAAYEPFIGRWSRIVALEFVDWLGVGHKKHWLDVGSGTGALSRAILDQASPEAVTGIDSSAAYVSYAQAHAQSVKATFMIGNAMSLPPGRALYDAVVSGLVLNFVPDPARALAEMVRVARPQGTVAVYLWDYAGGMQLLRYFWNAAVELDAAARDLDEGVRFPLCKRDALADLFRSAGLADVEARAIDLPTTFRDFDDYWTPFLGAQGPAPGYVASLSEDRREALRERIRESLPTRPDGSIPLVCRAWAARGDKR